MDHSRLGQSGLSVSSFGLGCGNFGGVGSAPEFFGMGESEEEAFALLDQAVELGITFLDTADAYGGGRSEATIGKWLATKDATLRDELLISSKVGNAVGENLDRRGLSRNHILRQVDESLGRLGVDRLDMYLIHEPDPATPLEETIAALDDVVAAGKVRSVGASNVSAAWIEQSLAISAERGTHRFEWIQNSFNLIDQSEQVDVVAVCRDQGLGFTPFSPLQGGMLTGKYDFATDYPAGSRMTLRPEPYLRFWTEETFDRIDQLSKLASDAGVSTAGLALAWLRHHPDVTATVVGPRRPDHFRPVAEAVDLELSTTDWSAVGALFGSDGAASTP